MQQALYIVFLFFSSLFSCQEKDNSTISLVKEWMGKEIIFTQNIQYYSRDNCNINFEDILKKEFKILFYVDSSECFKCKARLTDWNKLIYDYNQLYSGKVGFLFLYNVTNEKEVYQLLEYERFNYPIIIGNQANTINQLNNFSKNNDFQCLILNNENKIISIGNPITNPEISLLYRKYINKEKETILEKSTTIEIHKTDYDLGEIKKGTEQEINIKIKNVGDTPFFINDISTSCDCISTKWDKNAIYKTTIIKINLRFDNPGIFNNTVSITSCNIENTPINIRFHGIIK